MEINGSSRTDSIESRADESRFHVAAVKARKGRTIHLVFPDAFSGDASSFQKLNAPLAPVRAFCSVGFSPVAPFPARVRRETRIGGPIISGGDGNRCKGPCCRLQAWKCSRATYKARLSDVSPVRAVPVVGVVVGRHSRRFPFLVETQPAPVNREPLRPLQFAAEPISFLARECRGARGAIHG